MHTLLRQDIEVPLVSMARGATSVAMLARSPGEYLHRWARSGTALGAKAKQGQRVSAGQPVEQPQLVWAGFAS